MGRKERIEKVLRREFVPEVLEIFDESAAHRGHAGYREGGETHYRVRIRAVSLGGLSRVERQRRIYRSLSAEFSSGLHALSLDADGLGR